MRISIHFLNDVLNASDFNCCPLAVICVLLVASNYYYGSLAEYENFITFNK